MVLPSNTLLYTCSISWLYPCLFMFCLYCPSLSINRYFKTSFSFINRLLQIYLLCYFRLVHHFHVVWVLQVSDVRLVLFYLWLQDCSICYWCGFPLQLCWFVSLEWEWVMCRNLGQTHVSGWAAGRQMETPNFLKKEKLIFRLHFIDAVIAWILFVPEKIGV